MEEERDGDGDKELEEEGSDKGRMALGAEAPPAPSAVEGMDGRSGYMSAAIGGYCLGCFLCEVTNSGGGQPALLLLVRGFSCMRCCCWSEDARACSSAVCCPRGLPLIRATC